MSQDESELFDRDYLIESQLLHTEYAEANEEFRHRNRLIHNTFYLLIITTGVFLGLFFRYGTSDDLITTGGLVFAAGVASTSIGHLFLKHYHERTSAEVLRGRIERIANSEEESVERALSLNWGVTGGGAILGDKSGEILRRGSHLQYLMKLPDNILSAESIGLVLVYIGGIGVVSGPALASHTFVSTLISGMIFTILSILILFLYLYAAKQTRSRDEKPIY